MGVLWESLSDEQQKKYLDKASADLPKSISASIEIITIMAKLRAWQDSHACRHE
jgi:hypothetical protein